MKIRTRYAPSPTGRMHVGNLRTALYAYLIAKHEGGDFLLRIEDTDQGRLVEGAVELINETLADTGLVPDESPEKPGSCGPYVQSARVQAGIYRKYAEDIAREGQAYYCFCTKERLDSLKTTVNGEEILHYDKHCLALSPEEIREKLDAGVPYVIRQNNPAEGTTSFQDELYGEVTVENSELDDMVLMKSDGFPTYNFANVVDDHLMGITHVVRGNEYLSSSPKYNRLYTAFGWEIPKYIHCPLITDENHRKLSKRSGHSSFEDLLEQGFVAEAVVNFVALLGWSPEGNTEIMSLPELIESFDYHRISKSPAVFDMGKLRWMNGEYIKAMDFDAFYARALPYIRESLHRELDFRHIAELLKTRIEVFPDIPVQIDFLEAVPDYNAALFVNKKSKTDPANSLQLLMEVLPLLRAQEDFSNDALFELLSAFGKEKGYKTGFMMWPIRIALSGKQMTPAGATEIMELLGREESLRRIEAGIEKLKVKQA